MRRTFSPPPGGAGEFSSSMRSSMPSWRPAAEYRSYRKSGSDRWFAPFLSSSRLAFTSLGTGEVQNFVQQSHQQLLIAPNLLHVMRLFP